MLIRDFIIELIDKGMTQSEIARKSGVRQPTINRIYLGDSQASPGTIAKIARAFGRHPNSFMEWEGFEHENKSIEQKTGYSNLPEAHKKLLDLFDNSKAAQIMLMQMVDMTEDQRLDQVLLMQESIRKGR